MKITVQLEPEQVIVLDGVRFGMGDTVYLIHAASASKARGTVGKIYGVGRIRGVDINTEAFGRQTFPFGQPGDEERGFVLIHMLKAGE